MKSLWLLAALLPGVAPAAAIPFETFIRLSRGMSEAEAVSLAGPPDYVSDGISTRHRHGPYTVFVTRKKMSWMADAFTPYTTTMTIANGVVEEIEREKHF